MSNPECKCDFEAASRERTLRFPTIGHVSIGLRCALQRASFADRQLQHGCPDSQESSAILLGRSSDCSHERERHEPLEKGVWKAFRANSGAAFLIPSSSVSELPIVRTGILASFCPAITTRTKVPDQTEAHSS